MHLVVDIIKPEPGWFNFVTRKALSGNGRRRRSRDQSINPTKHQRSIKDRESVLLVLTF
jgi:hypothetical protein